MRTWCPRKERAGTPACCKARAARAAVTCSPVETSASLSRSSGVGAMALASARRRFVSPAMALTTTTTWSPRARLAATRPRIHVRGRRAPLPGGAEPPDLDVGPEPASVPADLLVHDVGGLAEAGEEGRVTFHGGWKEAHVLGHVGERAVEVRVDDDVLNAGPPEAVDQLGPVERVALGAEADAGGQAVEPWAHLAEPLEAERELVEVVGEEGSQEDDSVRCGPRPHPRARAGIARRLA